MFITSQYDILTRFPSLAWSVMIILVFNTVIISPVNVQPIIIHLILFTFLGINEDIIIMYVIYGKKLFLTSSYFLIRILSYTYMY